MNEEPRTGYCEAAKRTPNYKLRTLTFAVLAIPACNAAAWHCGQVWRLCCLGLCAHRALCGARCLEPRAESRTTLP
jgi:hypothetical protein